MQTQQQPQPLRGFKAFTAPALPQWTEADLAYLADTSAPLGDADRLSAAAELRRLSGEVLRLRELVNLAKSGFDAPLEVVGAAPALLQVVQDMDGWLANTGHGDDHPWRLSLRAVIDKATPTNTITVREAAAQHVGGL